MSNTYTRFCESCNHSHGPLYICPSYPKELKEKIEAESIKWYKQLRDPNWVREQLDKGTDPMAIHIFRILSE
jgi:galactose-1-phosphate uridylyltransferase